MPDTTETRSQTYKVREYKIPNVSNLAGYPIGVRQVKTSVKRQIGQLSAKKIITEHIWTKRPLVKVFFARTFS